MKGEFSQTITEYCLNEEDFYGLAQLRRRSDNANDDDYILRTKPT